MLAFGAALSRAASGKVSIDYATSDGSAHAGGDYATSRDYPGFPAVAPTHTISGRVPFVEGRLGHPAVYLPTSERELPTVRLHVVGERPSIGLDRCVATKEH